MNNYEEFDEYEEELEEAPKKKKFNIFDWYFKREGKGEPDDINALENCTVTGAYAHYVTGKYADAQFATTVDGVAANVVVH